MLSYQDILIYNMECSSDSELVLPGYIARQGRLLSNVSPVSDSHYFKAQIF